MTALDAYALLAYLLDEPAADEVATLLRSGECWTTSVNLAEVLDQLFRRHSLGQDEVYEVLSPLLAEAVEVRSVGQAVAWRAAELRARHYRRKDADLSLADCLLLAAIEEGDQLATPDEALISAADIERIAVVRLR